MDNEFTRISLEEYRNLSDRERDMINYTELGHTNQVLNDILDILKGRCKDCPTTINVKWIWWVVTGLALICGIWCGYLTKRLDAHDIKVIESSLNNKVIANQASRMAGPILRRETRAGYSLH